MSASRDYAELLRHGDGPGGPASSHSSERAGAHRKQLETEKGDTSLQAPKLPRLRHRQAEPGQASHCEEAESETGNLATRQSPGPGNLTGGSPKHLL